MDLKPGLYERLIDLDLESDIELAYGLQKDVAPVDDGESHIILANHLMRVIARVLKSADSTNRLSKQIDIYNRIVKLLATAQDDAAGSTLREATRLLAVRDPGRPALQRADTPISQGCILTRTRLDPTLESQLKKEMASSDAVDILCSFIKWSGIRRLKDELENFSERPSAELRVITTSYMGATDVKAVEFLRMLNNTSVKLSYDHERTRLHAKAFIFRRYSGFGTAYIGSANISNAALTDGLEWNVKISQYESPHLWEKMTAAFETHWNDKEFEPYGEADRPKLATALRQASNFDDGTCMPVFDLRPYPFQQEILDRIAYERFVGEHRSHLIVAATGTGKTMIAAFDYKAFAQGASVRLPTLLFVAHRQEILKQSLATFRAVLRDWNFGELWVGTDRPTFTEHLFMSIQSYSAANTADAFQEDHFDYIVVDEFHHADASTYRRLLDRFQPKCLLGLTATPERADGGDILRWFDGRITAEVRLPDAINRKLLCPFQYYGISDSVDLRTARWEKGGYAIADLEAAYVLDTYLAKQRAVLIIEKASQILLDINMAKGLGFCASVRHAEFMATVFNDCGISSIALTGNTHPLDRSEAHQKMRRGDINFIFTVDLFNEGVDIPEIDTVLFLRPTESLTVFLQQLGRGLRHSNGKECLTVLDFVGQQHQKYRFDLRYRALLDDPARSVVSEVQQDFPHLPAGCSVNLEKVARESILENIRRGIRGARARIVQELRDEFDRTGQIPTFGSFLDYHNIVPDDIYKYNVSWSHIIVEAGLMSGIQDMDVERLTKGLRRIQHAGGVNQIQTLRAMLAGENYADTVTSRRLLTMASLSLWGKEARFSKPADVLLRLSENPILRNELVELLEYRLDHLENVPRPVSLPYECPLELHAEYTRDELLAGVGYWSLDSQPEMREGVIYLSDLATDLFLITLNKTASDYSPSTMYDDYATSEFEFHWQSQSRTTPEQPTGQRYINHASRGVTVLLCVRENTYTASGLSSPYYFLGPADYVRYHGSRPMSIVWRMRYPMPARLVRKTARMAAA